MRKTGCSGFAYVVNYADDAVVNDLVFEDQGVKVFVDPDSLPLINGTTVDFVKQGLNEAFRFHNPNIKANVDAVNRSTSDRVREAPFGVNFQGFNSRIEAPPGTIARL